MKKMRIGILAPSICMNKRIFKDLIFAPRPLVIDLANGLTDRGHKVHLYGSSGLKVKAEVFKGDHKPLKDELKKKRKSVETFMPTHKTRFKSLATEFEMELTEKCFEMAEKNKLDIIHAFHGFDAHYFTKLSKVPVVFTKHDPLPSKEAYRRWRFKKYAKDNYVSISYAQRKGKVKLNFVGNVYNGIKVERFPFCRDEGKYLAFAGRLIPDKGPDTAIKVAKKSKEKLKIAGNVFGNGKDEFYIKKIKPYLGKNIRAVGFLDGDEKLNFLCKAKALLFPIKWEEPFGMVMIEAMACGTPVIAFNHGSVPEVVKDGKTGFIVKDENEMVAAVKKIDQINRKECREHVREKFSVERMVDGYEKIYEKLIKKKNK